MAALDPEEKSFQDRLENAVLDVMTSDRITSDDLSRWNLRSFAFKNIDAHISRACDDEQAHPERFFLLLTIYKCMQRLLEPAKAPVKRALSPTEKLYKEQKAKAKPVKRAVGRPAGPKVERKWAGEYARRLERMGPEKAAEFKAREAARIKAMRARRARIVPGA
jgi:hypothetical protein